MHARHLAALTASQVSRCMISVKKNRNYPNLLSKRALLVLEEKGKAREQKGGGGFINISISRNIRCHGKPDRRFNI
jgi:hypothetical protein